MNAIVAWKAGSASDAGLARGINEDRVLVDDQNGVFAVIDGLGGHAAGEMAAETAAASIREQKYDATVDPERFIRTAITDANNRVYDLAKTNADWSGMACVLTLAVLREEELTVGHVGDTRLYLVWNGTLRKITSDHSPVGELEDGGQLTEEEAMRHPRRNEVFRDVGSRLREPDDKGFIEIKRLPCKPDAALLLCTDGLTDVLPSPQITEIIDRYDGDVDAVAHQLVAAANQAGGTDNISLIFIAGPEFLGAHSATLTETRTRHAVTRPRRRRLPWRSIWGSVFWLVVGFVLGILLWSQIARLRWHI
ncbi:MAG: serine/threonine-protein phosphatase [Acidobacteriaceae bacterium]|nr:serine/threonine-protein phosphatase [Acidobacteriaceae bacterium]